MVVPVAGFETAANFPFELNTRCVADGGKGESACAEPMHEYRSTTATQKALLIDII
jgi:hypothetical protein